MSYQTQVTDALLDNQDNILSNGSGFSLLDGATSQAPTIPSELEFQKKVATDVNRPLEERIEAYEDIIESEIGDTTMTRARNIEREIGLRQIYLKFEGGNPSGTQKDLIAFAQAMDAMRRVFDAITIVLVEWCRNLQLYRAV